MLHIYTVTYVFFSAPMMPWLKQHLQLTPERFHSSASWTYKIICVCLENNNIHVIPFPNWEEKVQLWECTKWHLICCQLVCDSLLYGCYKQMLQTKLHALGCKWFAMSIGMKWKMKRTYNYANTGNFQCLFAAFYAIWLCIAKISENKTTKIKKSTQNNYNWLR